MTTLYDVPAEDLIEAAAVGTSLTRTKSKPRTGPSSPRPATPANCPRTGRLLAAPRRQPPAQGRRRRSCRRQQPPDRVMATPRAAPTATRSVPAEGSGLRKHHPHRAPAARRSRLHRGAAGGEGRRISAEGTAFLDELAGDVLRDLDRRTSSATPDTTFCIVRFALRANHSSKTSEKSRTLTTFASRKPLAPASGMFVPSATLQRAIFEKWMRGMVKPR